MCNHRDATTSDRFPRLPLLYGSHAVEVCPGCGSWRESAYKGRWREASELLIKVARDVLGWDDPV